MLEVTLIMLHTNSWFSKLLISLTLINPSKKKSLTLITNLFVYLLMFPGVVFDDLAL